jgi:hypothetical protein
MIFKNIIIHKTISVFNIPKGMIEVSSFCNLKDDTLGRWKIFTI